MVRTIRWPSKAKAEEYMLEISCTPDPPILFIKSDNAPCDVAEGEDGTCLTQHPFDDETWVWLQEQFADRLDVQFYEGMPEDWQAKVMEDI